MATKYGEKKSYFLNYGKPSLLLDFAKRKSLIDAISKTNLITFSRSSAGTYIGADGLIKTAAADESRFDHDPVTDEIFVISEPTKKDGWHINIIL